MSDGSGRSVKSRRGVSRLSLSLTRATSAASLYMAQIFIAMTLANLSPGSLRAPAQHPLRAVFLDRSPSTPLRCLPRHSARYGRPHFKLKNTATSPSPHARGMTTCAATLQASPKHSQANFDHSVAASADPMLQNSHVGMMAAFWWGTEHHQA